MQQVLIPLEHPRWPSLKCTCFLCIDRQVNCLWRAMMESSYKSPAAIPIAREPERMEHLVMCNKLLEEVRLLHCNEM